MKDEGEKTKGKRPRERNREEGTEMRAGRLKIEGEKQMGNTDDRWGGEGNRTAKNRRKTEGEIQSKEEAEGWTQT